MRKRMIVFIILVVITVTATYYAYMNSYKEFKPVTFKDDSFQYFEVEDQTLFNTSLKVVLEHYSIDYKIDKYGTVLVKRKVFYDKELLLNFTNKAMDSVWINYHSDFIK